ncbi:pentatricopeptide repeat-containing protein At4g38150 isoform X2 [Cajanus cajan]|uniref:Pentatricopeptide repeat-containing protein At4g38150 family n=2 Tax=Cajanus cajan TaxID=3821 RepID=A0A151TI45_CAJCA|nr:pentatricopeptide repeat-containing protein At4g38150 isoform X2 [Cajanus cajan]XP_020216999.1 pentatricopeptide repeat-containing protein At4g38150 isoform X2 [Cajanus cajan]XP_029127601.1 pentatricopeptide repeat-containing protein At4g38150 isoform X2 [Cajanus cajan]KYP66730.1 Pentatricopeptide repeat-containing protein At4g38150 family [Cajanus cajan]
MPGSLRGFPNLVSSSRIEKLVSLLHSKQYLSPWLQSVRHLSFTDDHGKQPAGESDDFFYPQSDSGSDYSNCTNEAYKVEQCLSESIPSRPLRGREPIKQHPHFRGYDRGSHSFPLRFDDPDEMDTSNKSSQINLAFEGTNVAETNRDAGQSGDSFLDKFKLGFDDKTVNLSDVAAGKLSEEAKRSNHNQPAQESMPQDADEIFKKMKETGLIPNAVAMLDGLCKDGLVQEALKLFSLMREKGTIPEIVIYTAVVDGYTKAHKADDAKRIFRKMQNNGISPNAFSYTVLIQGLYKCSRLQDAFEFCLEMLEAGHSPNVTTFVGLVDGFCKENGVEEAKGAVKKITEKGFTINEKAVREFLDKKTPFSPSVWEAIFGKKVPQRPF